MKPNMKKTITKMKDTLLAAARREKFGRELAWKNSLLDERLFRRKARIISKITKWVSVKKIDLEDGKWYIMYREGSPDYIAMGLWSETYGWREGIPTTTAHLDLYVGVP